MVTGKTTRPEARIIVRGNKYDVTFVPLEDGRHNIEVVFNDQPVPRMCMNLCTSVVDYIHRSRQSHVAKRYNSVFMSEDHLTRQSSVKQWINRSSPFQHPKNRYGAPATTQHVEYIHRVALLSGV